MKLPRPATIMIFIVAGLAMTAFAADPILISAKQGDFKASAADSLRPAINANGTVVAFESMARLTIEDKDRVKDIYVYDRRSKQMRLMHGVNPSFTSAAATLSSDGKILAFHSIPRPPKRNEAPKGSDIVWQKLDEGGPSRLASAAQGRRLESEAFSPILNSDGSRVLYTSNAEELLGSSNNPVRQVYMSSLEASQAELISKSDQGVPGNRQSAYARVSADGKYVAFLSAATNLDPSLPADSLGLHLYLRDMDMGRNTRLDVFERDFDASGLSPQAFDMDAGASIIVFEARHRDPANPFKSINDTDLYLYERATDKIRILTKGIFSNRSRTPSVSGDGRFVAFVLRAIEKHEDKGGLIVYDRTKDEWKRVVDGACANPAISDDGGTIAFEKKDKTTSNIYVVINPFLEESNAGH